MSTQREPVIWMSLTGIAVATAILITAAAIGNAEDIRRLLEWIDDRGAIAPLIFILVMALCVVFVLPGVAFTTGAGFLFGTVAGTLFVVIGTTIGSTLAFLLARHTPPGRYLGRRAKQFALSRRGLHLVNEEFERNGWKIILVSRLVPFFPGKLSNYVFGLTPVSLRGFAFGTFAGVIPFSIHNAYLGSLASDILTADVAREPQSAVEWIIYALVFVSMVVALIYISRLARRTLRKFTSNGGGRVGQCRG